MCGETEAKEEGEGGGIPLYAHSEEQEQETIRVESREAGTDSQHLMQALWEEAIPEHARQDETIRCRRGGNRTTSLLMMLQCRQIGTAEDSETAPLDYELLRPLGAGGMGIVYEARQVSIRRPIAVKMLAADVADDGYAQDAFVAEAEILGQLHHPNIVPIYELARDQFGTPFYSMQYIEGQPWSRVLSTLPEAENLRILMDVAEAVGFAHRQGILHRDIKPDNVMLGAYGNVILMDWGMAAPLEGGGQSLHANAELGGTPAYMPPEMASGCLDAIRQTSDIYLLGATLFEIISGKRPHQGKTVLECLRRAARNEIQPCEHRGELLTIARKAMASNPAERYPNVAAFQEAIRTYHIHHASDGFCKEGERTLAAARVSPSYDAYDRAIGAFRKAGEVWSENPMVRMALDQALLEKAEFAWAGGDRVLARSLLNPASALHAARLSAFRAAP